VDVFHQVGVLEGVRGCVPDIGDRRD